MKARRVVGPLPPDRGRVSVQVAEVVSQGIAEQDGAGDVADGLVGGAVGAEAGSVVLAHRVHSGRVAQGCAQVLVRL